MAVHLISVMVLKYIDTMSSHILNFKKSNKTLKWLLTETDLKSVRLNQVKHLSVHV